AVPLAALVDAILVVNNLRDLDEDRARGKRTFATLIGRAATRAHFLILILAAYGSIAAGIWLRVIPPLSALVILTVPDGARVWRWGKVDPEPRVRTSPGIWTTASVPRRVGLWTRLAFGVRSS